MYLEGLQGSKDSRADNNRSLLGLIENFCRLASFSDEKSSMLLARSWRVVSVYAWGDWDNRN
jgi:hypothetical protein